MTDPKTEPLYVRVTPAVKRALAEKAARMKMTPSDVVRELVTGLIEGRVTVSPPPDKESLYDVP
jgi:antitoxin component of RelBE/YafQ-DinJ toxin-antitoxin module